LLVRDWRKAKVNPTFYKVKFMGEGKGERLVIPFLLMIQVEASHFKAL
jgi:hypothetical protein